MLFIKKKKKKKIYIYTYIYILLLLLSNTRRQHLKEKSKDGKTWKSRSEKKMGGFRSVSLFHARKWEAVTQDGTRWIDHPTLRTQGACIVKGWKDKRDRGRIPDTLM